MKQSIFFQKLFGWFCAMFFLFLSTESYSQNIQNAAASKRVHSLPKDHAVEFLENKGQIRDGKGQLASQVLFKAQAPGLDLYVTETGLYYVFMEFRESETKNEIIAKRMPIGSNQPNKKIEVRYERVDMELAGASIKKENILKEAPSVASYNFLSGGNPVYGLKKYSKLTIQNIYPGIDWLLYNAGPAGFKYDFIIHPGADPRKIELVYKSKKAVKKNAAGDLIVDALDGHLQENAPYSYLASSGKKIESRFKLAPAEKSGDLYVNRIKIEMPDFESVTLKEVLVIDPQLVWCTYYGGSGDDWVRVMESDSRNNIYVGGGTTSTDLPLLNAGSFYQPLPASCFISKFSDSGALLWSTYYAGDQADLNDMAVDSQNNIFVCGETWTTTNMSFVNPGNGAYYQTNNGIASDTYISKFDSSGVCQWATLYGGTNEEYGWSIAVDANDQVVMVGQTASSNFPVLNAGGYFQATLNDTAWAGFIVKFTNAGVCTWASYVPAIQYPVVACDLANHIYVAGNYFYNYTFNPIPLLNAGGTSYYQGTATSDEVGIFKFDQSSNLLWCTYYGGSDQDFVDNIICDKKKNIFLGGVTTSNDFPLLNAGTYFRASTINPQGPNYNDKFLLKFDSTITLKWATLLGGSFEEGGGVTDNMVVDKCDNLYYSFMTASTDITVFNSCEPGYNDAYLDTSSSSPYNNRDIFITRFSNAGDLQWGTYFGGDGLDDYSSLALDNSGNLFVAGMWWVTNFPPQNYPVVNPGGPAYYQGFMGGLESYISKFEIMPVQSFSYGAYCVSDSAHVPSLSAGFSSGGIFTSSVGLNLNGASGQINGGSTPGSYTVTYSKTLCDCPSATGQPIASATVNILPAPSINVAGNSVLCLNQQGVLTANGASSYTWSNGASTSSIVVTFTTATMTAYTVTGADTLGCTSEKTVAVTGAASPTIAIAGNAELCVGEQGIYVAGGASSYTWSGGLTTVTISVIPTNTTPLVYMVTGANNQGCTDQSTVTIAVSICTGLAETNLIENTLRVYPNPNSGEFTITSGKDLDLTLVDEVGQTIQKIILSSKNQRQVEVKGLKPGIYFLNYKAMKQQTPFKIVVQD